MRLEEAIVLLKAGTHRIKSRMNGPYQMYDGQLCICHITENGVYLNKCRSMHIDNEFLFDEWEAEEISYKVIKRT